MMKVVIAGSRNITDRTAVFSAIESVNMNITEVVCGMARGVDSLGAEWGRSKGIPVAEAPADWNKHGKAAGHIRNAQMAEYCDRAIIIWDGESKGSANMIKQMKRLSKPYVEVIIVAEAPEQERKLTIEDLLQWTLET